jgi:hypothetical protein
MPGARSRAPRLSCSAPVRGLLLAVSTDLLGLYRQYRRLAIMFAGVQESSGNPCHLIGDGHTRLIDPNARYELPDPGTLGIGFVSDMADNRARAMNQEPSDRAVAPFGDPPSARLCPFITICVKIDRQ